MAQILITSPLSPHQTIVLWIVAIVAITTVITSVTKIVADAISKVMRAQLDAAVKQQMIEAGFAVEDMLRVLNHSGGNLVNAGQPVACEVVVDRDGEWATALVLNSDDDRFYVHFVGEEMSSNEWVPIGRVRFPNASAADTAAGWSAGGSSRHVSNGVHPKPAPIETEL